MATWTPRQLSDQVVRSLTASKITSGRLAVGTEITVGDPTQTHLSIGGSSLQVWRPDSDGGLRPTIQLGGADRDVVQITDPDTGETIAGFTDAGDLVAKDAVVSSITVGGMSMGYWEDPDDALWGFTRGTVGYQMPVTAITSSPHAAQTHMGAFETARWCQGGRLYRVEFAGTIYHADTGSDRSYIALRYTTNGTAPTIASPVLQLATINWNSPNGGLTQFANIVAHFQAGENTGLLYQVRVLVTFYRAGSGTARILSQATNPSAVTITDCGPVGSRFLAEGQMSGGGGTPPTGSTAAPTPPAPVQNEVRTYGATWGRTWYGDGGVRTDVGSDLIQGHWSYQNYSSIGFPAQIATDLAGATVSKVEVYLYAYHWGQGSGTAYIGVHGAASLPASFTYSGVHAVGGWKRGEGRWVTLPSTWYPAFATGTNKGITLGGGAPASQAVYGKFRGYNHSENPRLRITYTR